MATQLIMPKNGMDMQEGTLIRWLKQVGDAVEKDEPIMEIETDKVSMASEAPASGILLARFFDEGAVVPVLTVMGYIGQAGEAIPSRETAPPAPVGACAATPYARALARERGIPLSSLTPTGPHGEIRGRDVEAAAPVKATPLAAHMAGYLGVPLETVRGTGFDGKVTRDDVLAAAAAPAETLRRTPIAGMRRTIARRMTQSHMEIPTVQQNTQVDMTALLALRARVNQTRAREERLSVNDFILRAVGVALSCHPRLRTQMEEDCFVETSLSNVGMAVGLDDGLMVPVLHSADCKDLFALSAEAKALAEKARTGRLTADELGGGCITVSNLGMYQVHSFSPIINQPEASILGVGAILDQLALVEGRPAVRKVMMLCHVYDHRILNGAEAAQFVQQIKLLLEQPEQLLPQGG